MEFLTTPDLAASDPRWSTVASASVAAVRNAHVTPRAFASASTPRNANDASVNVGGGVNVSETPGGVVATPRASTAFYAPLDRAGIKNSFQSLFSPSVGSSTPALFGRNQTSAPGLTPFINGIGTPSLVPPGTGMLPNYPPSSHIGNAGPTGATGSQPAASPDVLSSPYLQAAAKEAVRREFMNMPSYVSPTGMSANGEREVPEKVPETRSPDPHSSMIQQHRADRSTPSGIPAAVPTMSHTPLPQQVSPTSGDAKVPTHSTPQRPQTATTGTDKGNTVATTATGGVAPSTNTGVGKEEPQPARPQGAVPPQMQPYFVPPQPHPTHGMVMFGQHGPMMMPGPPPGAMYAAPPGMVMFAGGQPPFAQHGMMMHSQYPHGQMVRPPGQPAKAESQAERKQRIENEKQELIREFKKKTREAALVRFRQKRRERRFGKLIRYDCRKKLADARPRVKGRFVRIKEDEEESESPQVVPDLDIQR